jgi:hypothetical protein
MPKPKFLWPKQKAQGKGRRRVVVAYVMRGNGDVVGKDGVSVYLRHEFIKDDVCCICG